MVAIERENYITTAARQRITSVARAKRDCEIYIIPGVADTPLLVGDDLVVVGELWFVANC